MLSGTQPSSLLQTGLRLQLVMPDQPVLDDVVERVLSPPLRCGRAIYFRRPEMAALVGKSSFQPKTNAAVS